MNDKDILEGAARAAGYDPARYTDDGVLLLRGVQVSWNSLIDDGDCAKLEAALEIDITWLDDMVICTVLNAKGLAVEAREVFTRSDPDSKNKARRRASTRAAALSAPPAHAEARPS